ncbi:stage II sporulation protein M [Flaviaesturariibacter aridisoli]|uniref:stage II sporulation protein M n=1 Tax=Flaviaesturariibacter aridisoli TaxID=2545761 RepID=UPI001405270E|nr:stage II sporulation protein M [Flaviaesturariibacter aridisoli]
MREGLFIKKNKDRWEQIEQERAATADETAGNFTRLVNDLAYAKTFYPTSKVTVYLNALASRIYLNIYQNRKDPSNRLARFFRYDVPLTIARHYRMLLFVFGLFVVFFSVGFFSALHDKGFVREVLGNGYVDMTERNIEKGNPFDVYAQIGPFLMWIYIMLNNIRVCLTYFGEGIVLGIPSLLALGREAIRIGAFEHMFYSHGLGVNAVVTVLLHGLLELTGLILSCGAGLIMGTSFLFPGTQRRMTAFQEGVKDGVKIIVTLIPVFMVAAFIEGYITRHYKMPLPYLLLILGSTGSFIVWYFVLYPWKLYRAQKKKGVHA